MRIMEWARTAGSLSLVMLLCCLPTVTSAEDDPPSDQIEWLQSAIQAADVAKRQNRPILVYIRSATCGYCDLLQRNVLENPGVVALVRSRFVPLKLTRERHPEHLKVLGVSAFPTVLVFSPDREFMFRIQGYVEAETFLDQLQAAGRNHRATSSHVTAARPAGAAVR